MEKWISLEQTRRLVENNVTRGRGGGLMRDLGELKLGIVSSRQSSVDLGELGKRRARGLGNQEKALSEHGFSQKLILIGTRVTEEGGALRI